jgi:dTDP-4-amino-4,6-dideoxygalactose transaminase
MIFQASPYHQYKSKKKQIQSAIKKVLLSGKYILGTEVEKFENEFARYIGVKKAISCASGTDALYIALKQLGIGPDDEILLPSHTALATVAAVKMTGAKPVYIDIKSNCYTIDPEKALLACSKKTKALIAVHIYGQSCDMKKLMQIARVKKIKIIEDCAQAVGSLYKKKKLGSIGHVGCFSFFPTKNLGAIGDGGCIVTNNKKLANKMKRFRQYGWDEKRNTQFPGINSRLDELQAAILRIKLRRLSEENLVRNKQANFYKKKLKIKNLILPKVCKDTFHSFHLFVIQCKKRDKLVKYLKSKNIMTALHYRMPAHLMAGYSSNVKLPQTEKLYKKILSLPLYPGLKKAHQLKVVNQILNFYENKN